MSLRFRTVLVSTLVATLVLAGAVLALLWVLRLTLTEGVADATELRARELVELVLLDQVPDPIPGDPDESLAQLVDSRGTVLAASAGLSSAPLDLPGPAAGERRLLRVEGLAGRPARFQVALETVRTPRGDVVVAVATSLEDVDEAVAATARILLVAVPLLVLALSGATWLLVGTTLSPIAAMSRRAGAIGVEDLAQRLPEPASRDEVHALSRTLNAMLARLEEGVTRQRRFVADAAHELRTPLAVLQLQLQTGGDRSLMLTELLRLQRLGDELLLLASLGPDGASLRRRPVDLDDVVEQSVARCPQPMHVAVDSAQVQPAQVDGDLDVLHRIVGNLLSNALQHAESRVIILLHADGDEVRLVVADDGPGIAPADRERVFEPFTRLDQARVRDGAGAGLGLTLVRDGVHAHGGRIQVGDSPTGGASFTVLLPASRS